MSDIVLKHNTKSTEQEPHIPGQAHPVGAAHPVGTGISTEENSEKEIKDGKRKRKRMSIRWKLVCYLAVFVSVLLIVLWLFQIVFLGDVYRNIKVNEIYTTAETIKRQVQGTGGRTTGLGALTDKLSASNQICILVLDSSLRSVSNGSVNTCYSVGAASSCFVHPTGSLQFASELLLMRFLTAVRQSGEIYFRDMSPGAAAPVQSSDSIFGPTQKGTTASADRETAMLYVEYFEAGETGFYLILNSKVTPVSATVSTLQHELIIISMLFIIAAVIMGVVLSRNISSPIIKINSSAKQLAKGDYQTVFEGDGYEEIAELRDNLNYAARELSKIEGFRRELIANVSHDLRTPLTMITGYAEVMRDLPGENTPENVQVIIDEGSRLTTLVNDLLDLSKLQSGAAVLEKTIFSLTDCVKSIIKRYQKLTESDGYDISFQYESDVYVEGDYSKLGQVIYNLVNNAISYTGEDKKVIITQTLKPVCGAGADASDQNQCVRISVHDTGMGISKENLEYIWDRYFKENKTHKRAVVGTGLGLSIVKGVLQMHHAQFGVETSEDAVNHGSTFWFEMNIAKEPDISDSV